MWEMQEAMQERTQSIQGKASKDKQGGIRGGGRAPPGLEPRHLALDSAQNFMHFHLL